MITWPSKNANQLRRTSAVVADGDDVAEMAVLLARGAAKHVDEAVGGAAAGEDDDGGGRG